jgi:hypothetical protein
MTKNLVNMLLGALLFTSASPGQAASTVGAGYVVGMVGDMTSISGGLLIRMDDNLTPTNCVGTPIGWMQISATDTAMISTFLTYWASGKRSFTIYTNPWTSGYCAIGQLDPSG